MNETTTQFRSCAFCLGCDRCADDDYLLSKADQEASRNPFAEGARHWLEQS